MARPPLEIGTYGKIRARQVGRQYEASAKFRMADGSVKRVRRYRTTKPKAENALKSAMVELATEARGEDINGDSRVAHIAQLWHADLKADAKLGAGSLNTARIYQSHLKNWVLPALGELRARELERSVRTIEGLLKRVRDQTSYDNAHGVRAVVSGVCGYAVRHGAMDVNPVRSAARLAGKTRKTVKAMTLEQRMDLIARLRELAQTRQVDAKGRQLGRRAQVWEDLPDLVQAMLSTGIRLGELMALDGEDVDPKARTVSVGFHIVRIPGEGLARQPLRKGDQVGLLLEVPEWAVAMWRRRKLASGGGPLFPSWRGTWSDPSNLQHRLREAFDECGYEWVTSHVFRKTVTTVLDEAGLPTTAIADQLGNTPAVVEKHYRAKRIANPEAAAALEGMFGAGQK